MAILEIQFMMKFILGEFLKILETALDLSFVWFCLKNDNLGLKMKILKFLGIQPTL